MCSYGTNFKIKSKIMKMIEKRTRKLLKFGKQYEKEAYRTIIRRVKKRCANVNPTSGVIILSLVSDTYNIYNVVYNILPELADEFIGWTNNFGIPIKIVIRPDSGEPAQVLLGSDSSIDDEKLAEKLAADMNISFDEAFTLVSKGIIQILFDKFGFTVNSKGFRVFHPQIGVLQGDGVSYKVIESLYVKMLTKKIDTMDHNQKCWQSASGYRSQKAGTCKSTCKLPVAACLYTCKLGYLDLFFIE